MTIDNHPLPHLSYSQLNLYEHCPRCYFLNYVLKVQAHPSQPLLFGGDVHNAIEYYHKHGEEPKLIGNQIRFALRAYTARFKPNYITEVEKGFLLTLRHPDTNQPIEKPFKLYIDGIRLEPFQKAIVEHKTAGQFWTKNKVDTERQATLYSYLFREVFNMPEDFIQYNIIKKPKGAVGFPDDYVLQVLYTKRDRSDYASLWHWADNIYSKIKRGEFPKSSHSGWKCDRCVVCV